MLSHRKSRRESSLAVANVTKRYRWMSEEEAGFRECSLRFDHDGKLIAVDFEVSAPKQTAPR